MLIDFDNAMRVEDASRDMKDVVGTHPFMSIGCLEGLKCPRNALDDWEAILYVVCWLGSLGINENSQLSEEEMQELPIKLWFTGASEDMGGVKREQLGISEFRRNILGNFNRDLPDWDIIQSLASRLHMTLFYNSTVMWNCRGYRKGTKETNDPKMNPIDKASFGLVDEEDENTPVHKDPLMSRTNGEDVKEISAKLLEVMEDFKAKAMAMLEEKEIKD